MHRGEGSGWYFDANRGLERGDVERSCEVGGEEGSKICAACDWDGAVFVLVRAIVRW
jgi:hypothetical protein